MKERSRVLEVVEDVGQIRAAAAAAGLHRAPRAIAGHTVRPRPSVTTGGTLAFSPPSGRRMRRRAISNYGDSL